MFPAQSECACCLLDRDGAYRTGNSLLRIKETERSLRVTAQAFILVLPVTFFFSNLLPFRAFFGAMCCVPVLQAIEKHTLFFAVGAFGTQYRRAKSFDLRRRLKRKTRAVRTPSLPEARPQAGGADRRQSGDKRAGGLRVFLSPRPFGECNFGPGDAGAVCASMAASC